MNSIGISSGSYSVLLYCGKGSGKSVKYPLFLLLFTIFTVRKSFFVKTPYNSFVGKYICQLNISRKPIIAPFGILFEIELPTKLQANSALAKSGLVISKA